MRRFRFHFRRGLSRRPYRFYLTRPAKRSPSVKGKGFYVVQGKTGIRARLDHKELLGWYKTKNRTQLKEHVYSLKAIAQRNSKEGLQNLFKRYNLRPYLQPL